MPWLKIVKIINFYVLLIVILENILGKPEFLSTIVMTMSFFILINHDNSLNLEKINICFNLNLIGIIYDLICILVSMINY